MPSWARGRWTSQIAGGIFVISSNSMTMSYQPEIGGESSTHYLRKIENDRLDFGEYIIRQGNANTIFIMVVTEGREFSYTKD